MNCEKSVCVILVCGCCGESDLWNIGCDGSDSEFLFFFWLPVFGGCMSVTRKFLIPYRVYKHCRRKWCDGIWVLCWMAPS